MLNLKREIKVNASKDEFIKILMEKTEQDKPLRLRKYRSIGGKDLLCYIEKDNLYFYPNTVTNSFFLNIKFRISGKLNEQKDSLAVKLKLSPPIWLMVLIFSFIASIILLNDFEWYSKLIFLLLIGLYVIDFMQSKEILTKLEQLLTNKDRFCERSEPQSYPVVGQARQGKQGSSI